MLSSLGDILSSTAEKFAQKTALVIGSKTYTYSDLEDLSNCLAASLYAKGIRQNDRVTLHLPNGWQWIVSYYAIHKVGAVANPLNVLLTPAEVIYALSDCEASAIISRSKIISEICDLGRPPGLQHLISVDGDDSEAYTVFDHLLQQRPEVYAALPRDRHNLSTICYTSGTTGKPKGAMLSHEAVLINAAMTGLMHGKTSEDIIVSALPLPHVYGNVVMNSVFLTGGTLVLHEKFDVDLIVESISQYRATMFEGVPTMYMYILGHSNLRHVDFSSLRCCTVGGQSMAPAKMKSVETLLGCPLIELWGMTELGGLGTTFAFCGHRYPGSIGIPLPYNRVRIVNMMDETEVLPDGEAGELLIKSPTSMTGYYKREKETREVMTNDGWLRTGDIARIMAEGCIEILDRKKDMIITAGYNIYPAEVEAVILQHPSILMAAVAGIADNEKGELAKAYIVLKQDETLSEREILAFCRDRLAAYKVPRAVQFLKDLPKTSTGKILRRELRSLEVSTVI